MFSKKTLMVALFVLAVSATVIVLFISVKKGYNSYGPGEGVISLVSPFQEVSTHSIGSLKKIWRHYFNLVSVAKRYDSLEKKLEQATRRDSRCTEIELNNNRLRTLLKFGRKMEEAVLPAEVIGKDPSPWFKSIVIDRGESEGLRKGLPVITPMGVVGLITETSHHYSTVLLITDRNCAVDSLVQRTRSPGIVKGKFAGLCKLTYALRQHDIRPGDSVISSGLDSVFPKGLPVGIIVRATKSNTGIFQDVDVMPVVNFEKMEEVFVVLSKPAEYDAREEE